MVSSWVHWVNEMTSAIERSGKCGVACAGLCLAASACGSHALDVGTVPDRSDAGALGGGASAADAGSGSLSGNSTCSIPNLDQYRLVFDSDGGKLERRIYSMRADGSDLVPLTPPDVLAREPALSPDGTQLAYTTPQGIQLLDMASGISELLVAEAGANDPSWFPDGSRLIYRDAWQSIGVLRMSDRVLEDVTGYSFGGHTEATPKGDALLSTIPNDNRIFIVPYPLQDTDSVITVGPTTISVTHPTMSPDGNWVAATFQCPNELSSIWVSSVSDVTPPCEGHRVTQAKNPSAINPEWGPGVLIAYERGEPPRDIAIVAADSGDECVIPGPGDDRNPSWATTPTQIPK